MHSRMHVIHILVHREVLYYTLNGHRFEMPVDLTGNPTLYPRTYITAYQKLNPLSPNIIYRTQPR